CPIDRCPLICYIPELKEQPHYYNQKAYGTSQECSNCGHKVKKQLSQRMHNCHVCHSSLCRDLNAAINIKNRGAHGLKAQFMSS
ncbi:transposase, partial [Chlorogloeopsis fritschii]|uniref:transposase n=1 Tax=Chlorogloeopsis fritschii TaxID=1124 RepID=UPI001F24C06C